ncbi:hypothetical protein NDU88_010882 [Pleurodeles waltl]|uniref:Uncharacterized protein n=1 Tax=Pleurodeles waltl TaxID=8319 RepID=A0AAV7QVM9_PLEWA|nr:hypothetical protein NDU88_010882 [Pleurodeles waltl]
MGRVRARDRGHREEQALVNSVRSGLQAAWDACTGEQGGEQARDARVKACDGGVSEQLPLVRRGRNWHWWAL